MFLKNESVDGFQIAPKSLQQAKGKNLYFFPPLSLFVCRWWSKPLF